MLVKHGIDEPLPRLVTWEERFERSDGGLLLAWARGREKARESPALAAAAIRGELPPLPWAGGLHRKLKKNSKKCGALFYLAMWQGLRGEPLCIDTEATVEITCSRFDTKVKFTSDLAAVARSTEEESAS